MFNKCGVLLGAVLLTLVAGCEAENHSDFVGHWVEINTGDQKPMTVDISYENNIFHIDETKTLFGKDFESKLEGKAESDTTISTKGGAVTMRLKNDLLLYKGRELTKSS